MDFPRPEKKPRIDEDSGNTSILEPRIAELGEEEETNRATAEEVAHRPIVELPEYIKRLIEEGRAEGRAEGRVEGRLEAEKAAEATSLLGTLYIEGATSPIGPIKGMGTASSNTNPANHPAARATTKEFKLFYLHPALSNELKDYNFELGKHLSCYIAYHRSGKPEYATEADVQIYVHNGLRDAVAICNILIARIAKRAGLPAKIQLGTRAESSLFSNIIDHVVVYDLCSGAPILAVETKKPFDAKEKLAHGSTNRLLGQGLDQLLAMKLMGHPSPFGLITCHNLTNIIWLNTPIYDDIVASQNNNAFDLNRLLDIVKPIPATSTSSSASNSEVAQSQSPTRIAKQETSTTRTVSLSPETNNPPLQSRNASRSIVVSKNSYGQDKNVDLYINAIFCSLDGFFRPRNVILLEKNVKVVVHDAIGMTATDFSWDAFDTTYRGPLTHNHRKKKSSSKLYLISYIGRGATSKVYRCITDDGYGCVAKIYVQRRFSDHTIMTEKEFQEFSEKKAAEELANFQTIYGSTALDGYVWREKLNKLDCLIMPFFEPIKTAERIKRVVNNGIREKLELFARKEKKFKECDQLWRHVGWFNNHIYLFDLGDLIDVNDPLDGQSDANNATPPAVTNSVNVHMEQLARKCSNAQTGNGEC